MTPETHAEALEQAGRHGDAVPAWLEAFTADPSRPQLAVRLALAMARVGRRPDAVELLQVALAMHPRSPELHTTRGNLLRALGRFEDALAAQDAALALAPASAAVRGNRCALFLSWNRPEAALTEADAALALAPDVPDLRFNRGTCLLKLGRPAEAARQLEATLALAPAHAGAHLNLGEARLALGDPRGAEAAFRAALEASPDDADAHWNLALRLLARGQWAEGWREYEWRRRLTSFSVQQVDAPEWEGGPLEGALLVTAEQGLGDTFQFLRYLPVARARAGRVVFECPPVLERVLGSLPGVELVARGAPRPAFVAHAPLLSLPLRCQAPPTVDPVVLCVDQARVSAVRARLGPGLHVGICWQGNPAYRADAQRSVPLRHFEALAALPGVTLVALQKQHGREQLAGWPASLPLVDLGASLDEATGPFVETAAALGAVDLLVSSDTAVPHLAGVLGREVWLVLPHQADWRWGAEGSTTPWYPRFRLFRQPSPGDWAGVFAQVAQALRERVPR